MNIKMTPLKVEILLWYYYSPFDFPQLNTPAAKEAINEFCKAGIMKRVDRALELTELVIEADRSALEVYVNELLSVPLPTKVWVCKKDKQHEC